MSRLIQILADGRPGGGTTAVLTLTRLLAEQASQMTIATQAHSYLAREAGAAGQVVAGFNFSRRSRTPQLSLELARLFRRSDPTVVHAHGARAALPAVLASMPMSHRFIYTVHGFHFPHKAGVARSLARAAEAFCISRADCTVFVSDADREIARSAGLLGRSQSHCVIKNAVFLEPAATVSRKLYDICFVGRLHPQKNPLILVDILKAMQPMRPTLCIVGGGELAGQLEARVHGEGFADQVLFKGECDRLQALQLLSSCRALVLPSLWEGHPITLVEAMHLGVPAVASDISGNDEIVRNDETGILVTPTDANAYSERLTRLLADDVLRARLAAAGMREADRQYSPKRLLDEYLQVYDLVSRQAPLASHGLPA